MLIEAASLMYYQAFGCRIQSSIPLPELADAHIPADPSLRQKPAPVSISITDLLPLWSAEAKPGESWVVRGNTVMFHVPEVAFFRIEEGRTILVCPVPGSDPNKIRLYVLGTCMGVLLLQRGVLPLHGSAVAIEGKAYAIVGHSGAGKSTLAAVLLAMGYRLLSDDVIPVVLAVDHTPIVFPSYPQQKLWQDSMEKLGVNNTGCQPLFDREQKYAVPVLSGFHDAPMPLGGVFELVREESDPGIQAVEGLERFHTLLRHTFRRSVMEQMGLMDWHFSMLVRFINRLPVHRIIRPSSGFTAPGLGSLLLQTIRKEKIS